MKDWRQDTLLLPGYTKLARHLGQMEIRRDILLYQPVIVA
jgi:hypothetical protein